MSEYAMFLSRARAYTLIEMLMVTAILGLTAGLVVARMDTRLPGYRLRAAARELASTLAWARSESLATGLPVTIRCGVAQGEYGVDAGASARGVNAARRRLPDRVRFDGVSVAGAEPVTQGTVDVVFTSLGGCKGHWFYLTDASGEFYTVEVLPLGAQVNIYDVYHQPETLRP